MLIRVIRLLVTGLLAAALTTAGDWTTFAHDPARSGWANDEKKITRENVASLRLQWKTRLENPSYSLSALTAPIVVTGVSTGNGTRSIAYVAGISGIVFAVDAQSGELLWTKSLKSMAAPRKGGLQGTYLCPNGITATPVIDKAGGSLYVIAPDGSLYGLGLGDGKVKYGPAPFVAPFAKSWSLNFVDGVVYGTVSLGCGNGRSGVYAADVSAPRRPVLRQLLLSSAYTAGIWGRGGAVIDTATGDIFVATGNGPWDGRTSWGDALLQLDPDATRLLGNYTPANTQELDQTDTDLGSSSPVLLGGGYIAQGGKDGSIRLLSIKQMAGAAPHKGGELQSIPTPGETDLFSTPAVFHSSRGTWMFVADDQGTAAWYFRNGKLQPMWHNTNHGTSPIVAGGLLYIYDQRGALRVYEPDTGRQIVELKCGAGHWNSPIVVDGKIALPEGNANHHNTTGILNIWRLKSR